jgi:molybdate transport repressor ModE-like protein
MTLRAVAERGSLAAAARTLGYSQPAVGQQLAALERLVGARLVDRQVGGRQASLTDTGERVLRHGRSILARAQAAEAELRALADGNAGTLRLGTIPSIGARLVPELLRRFARTAPDVTVELVEDGFDDRLLARLEEGRLDLTFAFAPFRDGPFASVELMHDPYVLLVARDSPLAAARRPLSARRLAKLPLIVCSQSDAADAYCTAQGVAAQIRHRIDDNQTLVGLAAAGLGAALLPRLAVDPARDDVVAVELAVKPPPRIIEIAWHVEREQSPAAEQLVASARALCDEHATAMRAPAPPLPLAAPVAARAAATS